MTRLSVSLTALLIVGCAAAATNAQRPAPTVAWEITEGVSSPESVYFDEASGFLFVSQIGDGGATRGNRASRDPGNKDIACVASSNGAALTTVRIKAYFNWPTTPSNASSYPLPAATNSNVRDSAPVT